MKTSSPSGLGVAALAAALMIPIDSRAVDQLDFYGFFARQPIAGIPSGAYSSWSEDERRDGLKAVVMGCTRMGIAAVMQIPQQEATQDRTKEELQTLGLTCMAVHLPIDHPDRPKFERQALLHYETAKSLGSVYPRPDFAAAATLPSGPR